MTMTEHFDAAGFLAARARGRTYFAGCSFADGDFRGADFTDANLTGADFTDANLTGADFTDANLTGANLAEARGVIFADCSWSEHGECGRRLLGVIIDGTPQYFCGCFRGSEAELRAYIADGDERYRASRTLALNFVAARLREMMAGR